MPKRRYTINEAGVFVDRDGHSLGRITSISIDIDARAILEWHTLVLRAALYERAGEVCERCGHDDTLQMHHKTYERFGHELLEDVELLCQNCHRAEHDRLSAAGTPLVRPAGLGDRRGERRSIAKEEKSPDGGVGETTDGQGRLVADPVEDVFNHYRTALERPKAQLQPKVRRWISDAIEAVGIERCKRAIDGLAASEHHRQGGYVGIEYALRPKVGQTIEGRVAMMEAKAPNSSNGQTTVADLLASVPSGGHDIVRTRMENVRRMYESPDHEGTRRLGQESARQLREAVPHVEPVIEQCRIVGWRRVEA